MKRFIQMGIIALVAVSAFAQSGTLASSEVPVTITQFVVGDVTEHRANPAISGDSAKVMVTLWKLDAGASTHDNRSDVTVQMVGAEIVSFEAARSAVASNETGGGARVQNFRVLTFLKANCATFATPCDAKVTSMTLVP